MAMKKTGWSLHDYLAENDMIDGSDKPDIRTVKQKQADLAAQHKAEKLALAGER
jgi:hypothetical protein